MMDKQKWQRLSLCQQLGNIGSEISRARYWENQKDTLSRNRALERVFQYLEFMLEDKQSLGGYKELARFREVIGAWFSDQDIYDISPQALEDYCMDFAVKGRSHLG